MFYILRAKVQFFFDFPTFLRYFLLTSPEELQGKGVSGEEFSVIFAHFIA